MKKREPVIVTHPCAGCQEPMTYMMRTRRRVRCDDCVKVNVAKWNATYQRKPKTKRRVQYKKPKVKKGERKLIPYAGYDPTEGAMWRTVEIPD